MSRKSGRHGRRDRRDMDFKWLSDLQGADQRRAVAEVRSQMEKRIIMGGEIFASEIKVSIKRGNGTWITTMAKVEPNKIICPKQGKVIRVFGRPKILNQVTMTC